MVRVVTVRVCGESQKFIWHRGALLPLNLLREELRTMMGAAVHRVMPVVAERSRVSLR